jgi:putative ABC transport system permease protein
MVWMLMHSWLQDFAYRITIQWWMLLGAGGIVLGITILTVGFHAVRAAMAQSPCPYFSYLRIPEYWVTK